MFCFVLLRFYSSSFLHIVFIEHWNCALGLYTIFSSWWFRFFSIDFIHSFVLSKRCWIFYSVLLTFLRSFRNVLLFCCFFFVLTSIQFHCKAQTNRQCHRKYIQDWPYTVSPSLSSFLTIYFGEQNVSLQLFQLCFHTCKMDDQTN